MVDMCHEQVHINTTVRPFLANTSVTALSKADT